MSHRPAPDAHPDAHPDTRPDDHPAAELTRRLAASAVLVAVAFVQPPGWISADTKLDLLVDPVGFLRRALTLWEPLGSFGQLQNQAYGYLLPMGPFFALGQAVGLPVWVVQRLWWSLLLLLAFWGVLRLAGRLGIGTEGSRIIAGLAFALSPRTITELGGISVELWPSAMAPWVLVPLVSARRGRERSAAARSALAVAAAGGVNAVAAGAVLPLPALWLALRPRGTGQGVRPGRLAAWWAGCVVLAVAWWLGPLLLLGRYSPPFLDWIESAAITTSTATPANALRGVSHWVGWLGGDTMTWPAGLQVATTPLLAGLAWAALLVALAGLVRRDLPHRGWLLASVVAGLTLLTLGHVGAASAPWAGAVRDLLDGPGAALRNTHKFDPVLRLPLALGLAHAVAVIRLPVAGRLGWTGHLARVVAVCAVMGAAVPAAGGHLLTRNPFLEVPGYWRDAAQWLTAHDDGGRTLVVPGAPFATSLWGDPRDEPLQALAGAPWAARVVVPLAPAGTVRMLTTIEQQLSTGRPSPGLAGYLARAGITRVLVRADLAGGRTPTPLTVRAALTGSPGLVSQARFGPVVGATRFDRATLGGPRPTVIDSGLDVAVPAIEIFQVQGASGPATLWPRAALTRVTGGPENLLALTDAGLLDGPSVLTGDPDAAAATTGSPGDPAVPPLLLTDGPPRREATFSSVRDVYGPVLSARAPWRDLRRVHDWTPFEQQQVVAAYDDGVEDVSASTEADAASGAWSAFDGDPTTAWRSDLLRPVLPWLRLDLAPGTTLPAELTLRPGSGAQVLTARVSTGAGQVSVPVERWEPDQPVTVPIPAGASRWVRVEFTRLRAGSGQQVAVAEVTLPGIAPRRTLVVPPADAPPSAVVLRASRSGSDRCAFLGGRPLCGAWLARPADEGTLDRTITVPMGPYTISGTARPLPGASLDASLRPLGDVVVVTAGSRRSDEPAERPQAAMDRDTGTGWVAAPDDAAPAFTLTWPTARRVDALQLQTDAALAVSRATRVRLRGRDLDTTVDVGADGWVRFPPRSTTWLQVTVLAVDRLDTLDPDGVVRPLPFGVSEVVVPALDDLRRGPDLAASGGAPCGFGPPLSVDGVRVPTRVEGTLAAMLRRLPMRVVPCPEGSATPATLPPATLSGGTTTRLALASTAQWRAEGLVLRREGADLPGGASGAGVPVGPRRWQPEDRVLDLDGAATERVLVVHENANPGWRADLGGHALAPVRIDGWQQGWLVPAGAAGTVHLRFVPGPWYRAALLLGAVCLLALVALAVRRPRRRVTDDPDAAAVPTEALPVAPGGRVRALVLAGAGLLVGGGPVGALGLLVGVLLARWHRRVLLVGFGAVAVATAAAATMSPSVSDATGAPAWASAGVWALAGALVAGLAVTGSGVTGSAATGHPAPGALAPAASPGVRRPVRAAGRSGRPGAGRAPRPRTRKRRRPPRPRRR